MNSMTGFGKGTFSLAGVPHLVELRSLNNRFLDVKVRLPWFDAGLEARVTERVRAALARGRVDVVISQEQGGAAGEELELNQALARRLGELAGDLAGLVGVSKEAAVAMLPPRTDLVSAARVAPARGGDEAWAEIQPGLDAALDDLGSMRAREGASHREVLEGHRAELMRLTGDIAALAAAEPDRLRAALDRRLARLTGGETGVAVDPVRLAQEVALLASRADVTEEMDRLGSHFDQIGELHRVEGEPLGRKLEFLQQELLREFNTTGSKTQDPRISHKVVEAKGVLEKVRELIQNVE